MNSGDSSPEPDSKPLDTAINVSFRYQAHKVCSRIMSMDHETVDNNYWSTRGPEAMGLDHRFVEQLNIEVDICISTLRSARNLALLSWSNSTAYHNLTLITTPIPFLFIRY